MFDLNEWFVIISLIVTYLIMFKLRQNYSMSFIFLIILFTAAIARIADHTLAAPPIQMYDLMDYGMFEFFDIFTYFLYGPYGFFFVYLYERLNVKGVYTALYLLVWSILSVFYEWVTIQFGVFTFHDWKSIYSLPIYFFVQSLLLIFYLYLKKTTNHSIKNRAGILPNK